LNSREIVRRLQGYVGGRPQRRGENLSLWLAEDQEILVVVFVRIGGEARPWGIAYGTPSAPPTILSVTEGRDRDTVAEMMATFAPVILNHVQHPRTTGRRPLGHEDLSPLRQLWLPGGTHLSMLHHLAYAYTFTRFGGDNQENLHALGRACGWLFREANRPGEQHVVVASAALRSTFSFPSEDMRQGHLGYLLAWLSSTDGYEAGLAKASDAERESVATTLNPHVERNEIEPALEAWKKAQTAGSERSSSAAAARIESILERELGRRFELTVETIARLRSDGRRLNAGMTDLVDEALKQQWGSYLNTELRLQDGLPTYIPAVETDRNPAAAAAGYQAHMAAAENLSSLLIHDDEELLAEAIADGNAFHGTIVDVNDAGEGRKRVPIWTVRESSGNALRLRTGSRVCVVGLPRRTAQVKEIHGDEDGSRRIELEILNLKLAVKGAVGRDSWPPVDSLWVGQELDFVDAPAADISIRKSFRSWKKDVPGAWLTHARPGGQKAQPAAEVDLDDQNAVLVETK
jgi:hypothetical protein